VPSCTQCDDTTWKTIEVDGAARVTRCECWWRRAAESQMASARIPQRYRQCTLDNFETHYDSLRNAVRKSRIFIDQYPAAPKGLMFLGSYGVGKTHLAVAVLKELIVRKGARAFFYEVPDLLKLVRDSYDAGGDQSELGVLEPVLHADLLVLDDLGEERTSEWVQETLAHVINVRYSESRATIFTSNLRDSPDSTDPRSFFHKLGGRTRSRLIEMCEQVYMDREDAREVGPSPSPDRIAEWQEKSPASSKNVERTRRGGFPAKTTGQLKSKLRFGSGEAGRDLKWPGGKAGSQ
jgi:DNA replication protein DnaC